MRYDSGGGGDGRLIAVHFEEALPPAVHNHLRREGVWYDSGAYAGPVGYFRAALQDWPAEGAEAGGALAELIGATCRVSGGEAGACARRRTQVMGILNVTPDSFYDGGQVQDPEAALAKARRMVEDGADIIDVGGESTRPNATPVPLEEELRRVVPVVRELAANLSVPISVDTYKAKVAEAALEAGAAIVNDISGLRFDPDMARVAADHGAGLVVMHIKGTPRTMQQNPVYDDVVAEVKSYLAESCERAIAAGVDPEKIWIDPGIGFGKTVEHNLELLRCLRAFRTLGFPILVGTSNKSFIGHVLGLPVEERTEGTAATVALAVANGAAAVRVHDVRAMSRVVRMADAIVYGKDEPIK